MAQEGGPDPCRPAKTVTVSSKVAFAFLHRKIHS